MTWYYQRMGNHIHVRVFLNGALNGTLVFNLDEWQDIQQHIAMTVLQPESK